MYLGCPEPRKVYKQQIPCAWKQYTVDMVHDDLDLQQTAAAVLEYILPKQFAKYDRHIQGQCRIACKGQQSSWYYRALIYMSAVKALQTTGTNM